MSFDDIHSTVQSILEAVKTQGAAAVAAYTREFDHINASEGDLLYDPFTIETEPISAELKQAIDGAAAQIRRFHDATRPVSESTVEQSGLVLRERWIPLRRAGIYAPNGAYPLVSSLLMTAIPAQCAGVHDMVVAISPRHQSRTHPVWNYALKLLGIRTVLAAGGAQAIAALAYGVSGLAPVDVIAGPGNSYVAIAKQLVANAGVVGIDGFAGPSEVAVIADSGANPSFIAMDLLAQAEHGPDASATFITWDPALIAAVQENIGRQVIPEMLLGTIRYELVANPLAAATLVNRLAPEHLGLIGPKAEALSPIIETAGALFIGEMAGEALGDYIAGPSHVLPTHGTGRFASGLSTRTFMRKMSVIEAQGSLDADLLAMGARLAQVEGLRFHQQALEIRNRPKG